VAKDARSVSEAVLEGTRGRRVLLSGGWAGLGSHSQRDGVMVAQRPLPHSLVFPRVAAVVHHGGAGTMATALRAGTPQVIVPHIMDQYYWARRLETLGISGPAVPVRKLDGAKLARAIDASLKLPAGPRIEARRRLEPGGGRERAVAFVEGLVKR
jgi:sterol 3beta-glucosyltransferase